MVEEGTGDRELEINLAPVVGNHRSIREDQQDGSIVRLDPHRHETGERGIELAGSSELDVVLLDIMLPLMDGFDVCRRIREMSPVPVIILTARGQETDKLKGFASGADDYVGPAIFLGSEASRYVTGQLLIVDGGWSAW